LLKKILTEKSQVFSVTHNE